MTITALPPAPQTTDPTNFDARADALLSALPTFVNEANATAAAMNFNSTNGTSVTSVLIGTGSKVFTADTGKSWQLGMTLRVASTATPTNFMTGEVTAYNSGTGSLTVNVTSTSGSGTIASWTISQAGISLQAPVLDLTGYSGSDVTLGVGQSAFYIISAVTTLLLRIATLDNQIYEIHVKPNWVVSPTATGQVTLSVNNAALGTAFKTVSIIGNTIAATTTLSSSAFKGVIDLTHSGATLRFLEATVFTGPNGKCAMGSFGTGTLTENYIGKNDVICTDTTTQITSLGTLGFINSVSGLVYVKRIL